MNKAYFNKGNNIYSLQITIFLILNIGNGPFEYIHELNLTACKSFNSLVVFTQTLDEKIKHCENLLIVVHTYFEAKYS